MKRLSIALPFILLLGILVPPASAVTERQIVPFRTREVACSGERVRLSGELLLINHGTEDSNGGFHAHFSVVLRDVVGVSASGVKYHAVGGQRDTFNLSGRGTLTVNSTFQFNLISEGGDQNLQVIATFHTTITPNGDVTAFVDNFRIKCVG
jgi:hypothetical protein